MNYVQSFIDNFSVPTTLEELLWYIREVGEFDIEELLRSNEVSWTVLRWCKIGDIVFFMHAKHANTHLRRLKREATLTTTDNTTLRNNTNFTTNNTKTTSNNTNPTNTNPTSDEDKDKDQPEQPVENEENSLDKDNTLTPEDKHLCSIWLDKAIALHKTYGGKILALGKVIGPTEVFPNDGEIEPHWGSTLYADIEVTHLENPVDISEFRPFIKISPHTAITGVFGDEFKKLMSLITQKNSNIPDYYTSSVSATMPLSKISQENYLDITAEYRHAFMLEAQFRSFYVNYLLKDIGDQKKFYYECCCRKEGQSPAYVDNVILFNGKYLPVEVKLNVDIEPDLIGQLQRYVNLDWAVLNNPGEEGKKVDQLYNAVLVIDTNRVDVYNARQAHCNQAPQNVGSDNNGDSLQPITDLNDLKTKEDVLNLKQKILHYLVGEKPYSFPLQNLSTQALKNIIFSLYSKGPLLSKAADGNFSIPKELCHKIADTTNRDDIIKAINDCTGIAVQNGQLVFCGFGNCEPPAPEGQQHQSSEQQKTESPKTQSISAFLTYFINHCNSDHRMQIISPETDNERFTMRRWFTQMGWKGIQDRALRMFFYEKLSGHTAFRTEESKVKWLEKWRKGHDNSAAFPNITPIDEVDEVDEVDEGDKE